MHEVIFYPIGNGDTCLIRMENGSRIAFDFADLHDPSDKNDKRMPLAKNFKEDIGWPKTKEIDVLAITHGDIDHVKRIPEVFWLEFAAKYQGEDRIKFKEMWVPAALIVEEGSEDDTKIVRQEARHRFLNKKGIRVFSRPERLREWLKDKGKKLEDYLGLITDAGQIVPGWTLDGQGIEFFVHSPFAERDGNAILDRNGNCLFIQAVFRIQGEKTRFLVTGDITYEELDRIVKITRAHKNAHRLAWDIYKIPHHCSYKSLAKEKGKEKTKPTPEIAWLLDQGFERSVMVSSSDIIPSISTDQPPHVEAYRTYQDTERKLDADLIVTMENPSKRAPARTMIEIGKDKAKLKKSSAIGAAAVTSTYSPRVG
jgi:beta-lactamase superfamily II metal-dependent hydrolase